jgi:SRSO17 transposase
MMTRYFFDLRDNNRLLTDNQGTALDSVATARQWAVGALSEYIKDIVPNESPRSIAVEVRDEASRPLMKATMVFEVEVVASDRPGQPKH